jgi:hypothetical protein
MTTFRNDIIEAVGLDTLLLDTTKIRINNSLSYYREDHIPKAIRDAILSWEQAAPYLDYPYDSGYGSADCHDINIWTVEKVWYIHEYDGSTSLQSVSRNP